VSGGRPDRHYYRVGSLEVGVGARYDWRDAYSYFSGDGGLIYPWHGKAESKSIAKRAGFRAVFHDQTCSPDDAKAAEMERRRAEEEL